MTDEELTKRLADRGAVVVHVSHHANMREGGGSVGVMFKPSTASVISVSNKDSGSRTDGDGKDHSDGKPLTPDSFEETFDVVGAYNEWRVQGSDVAGIFVHDTQNIMVKKWLDVPGLPNGEVVRTIGGVVITLSEVFGAFPGLPVFTMTAQGLVELKQA